MKDRLKYNNFHPVNSSQGFWETEYQQDKERETMSPCNDGLKLCSINLNLRTERTDWKVLLVCQHNEIMRNYSHGTDRAAIGKLFWHLRCRTTWPFNLPKVHIKLNCPRKTSGNCLHVGPWRVVICQKKNLCFLWDNSMCTEGASSGCSFHLLSCLLSLLLLTAARSEATHYELA